MARSRTCPLPLLDSPLTASHPNPSECHPLAIVGIGCRMPGSADSPDAFWQLLSQGRDAVETLPSERWSVDRFYSPDHQPGKTISRWGGLVREIDRFDPGFFGISPREAAKMDPQQRLALEVAWRAIEDSATPWRKIHGSQTGVFLGISSWDYSLLGHSFDDRGHLDAYSNTGTTLSIASNRISYCFDLRGPSLSVDTACSSSLMAIHLACQSLWRGESLMALAGGVNVLLAPEFYVSFSQLGVLSPDGRCKTFDARANGYVRSEGAGMILLKPLDTAQRDGDRIYAVIRGSATNQDGRSEGLTVPNGAAQESLIREACRHAGVQPENIQYVEAHGTGTPVGDPIEFNAIAKVVGRNRADTDRCWIGSVKTNIGHLEAGAGIASTIKVALALHHGLIPPHLHFEQPHPNIDLKHSGLQIPLSSQAWTHHGAPRLAGVNGFGYGGANVHLVLEEAPYSSAFAQGGPPLSSPITAQTELPKILYLSSRSREGLRHLAQESMAALGTSLQDHSPKDIAHHSAFRGHHFEHRLAVVGSEQAGWARAINQRLLGSPPFPTYEPRQLLRSGIVFACCGQGPQTWNMGRQLYAEVPAARLQIDACDTLLSQLADWSLVEELHRSRETSRIQLTAIAQPALFAIQLGLAAYWRSEGIEPSLVIGHSVGEIAAAFLAGSLSLEDACCVAFHRGRTMDRVSSQGRMLAVGLSEAKIRPWIAPYQGRIVISAMNGPESLTLSGDAKAIENLESQLTSESIFARLLNVEYAFHSPLMEPVREELLRALTNLRPQPPQVPFYSTVTGSPLGSTLLDAEYWWQNVRQPVQFHPCARQIAEQDYHAWLELGPHPVLSFGISETYSDLKKQLVLIPSLHREQSDIESLQRAKAQFYEAGHSFPWDLQTTFQTDSTSQTDDIAAQAGIATIPFPTQVFVKQKCWSETHSSRWSRFASASHPTLGAPSGSPEPLWKSRIDLRNQTYLKHHLVRQTCVLPAAVLIESSLEAAKQLRPKTPVSLGDIRLLQACVLSETRAKCLEHAFDPERERLTISVRDSDDDAWTKLASVQLLPTAPPAIPLQREKLRSQCPIRFEPSYVYDYCRELGLDYGPSFQGIVEAFQGHKESLTHVVLPPEHTADASTYLIHPALLDAAFHTMIVADPAFGRFADGLYLPFRIERCSLYQPLASQQLWVHATLISKTDERLLCDLRLYDQSGQLVIAIEGFESHRFASLRQQQKFESLLYRSRWHLSEPAPPNANNTPKTEEYLLPVGGPVTLAQQLVDESIASGSQASMEWHHLDTATVDAIASELRSWFHAHPQQPTICWLQALAPSDCTPSLPESFESLAETQVQSLRNWVQAWDQVAPQRSARMLIATTQAQPFEHDNVPVDLRSAPLVGMARVVMQEAADWKTRLIDLPPPPDLSHPATAHLNPSARPSPLAADQFQHPEDWSEWLAALHHERCNLDEEDEVLHRNQARWVCRFAPHWDQPLDRQSPSRRYRLPIHAGASIESLKFVEDRVKPLLPHEIEVQVRAAALNFSDVMKALGLYPGKRDEDHTLGAECAGIVTRVGSEVIRWKPGDRVMAVGGGSFASHVILHQALAASIPEGLSDQEAATIPIAFLTASHALEHCARLRAGDRVLIHSATGGVGMAALQLAQQLGAIPYATASTDPKRALALELGAHLAVDSRDHQFADQLRDQGVDRVDVVLNSLPGKSIQLGLDLLATGGTFLEIGKRDIYGDAPLGLYPFRNNIAFFGIDLDQLFQTDPELMGDLLANVANRIASGELSPLPATCFHANQIVDAFRWMQQGKHVGKVVVDFQSPPDLCYPSSSVASSKPSTRHTDPSTCWIVGGLGGFGLELACWQGQSGTKHLVLSNRSVNLTSQQQAKIDQLQAMGVQVHLWPLDITDLSATKAMVARIQRELPPLRSVFHTAMVLKDQLIVDLDDSTLQAVLRPKVLGGWNLHDATQHLPLDAFVLFSSLSSVFGHAGQANYSAANAFLDSLAHHRRHLGLPATVINWGHLADAGYLARQQQLSQRLIRQGVLSFPVQQAMDCLQYLLESNCVQASVLSMDWSQWRGLGITQRVSLRFRHLTVARDDTVAAELEETPLDQLFASSPDSQHAYFLARLVGKVASLLGLESPSVLTQSPLLDLGLDSLMAVELRNWIQHHFETPIPVGDLLRKTNLQNVAATLTQDFQQRMARSLSQPSADSSAETPLVNSVSTTTTISEDEARDILEKLPSMEDREVEYWLDRLAAAGYLPGDEESAADD